MIKNEPYKDDRNAPNVFIVCGKRSIQLIRPDTVDGEEMTVSVGRIR